MPDELTTQPQLSSAKILRRLECDMKVLADDLVAQFLRCEIDLDQARHAMQDAFSAGRYPEGSPTKSQWALRVLNDRLEQAKQES